MDLPYMIWSPEWRHVSGGIRVLHVLADELRQRGFNAVMHMTHGAYAGNPFDVPCSSSLSVAEQGEAIHVFPEITVGNPSGSDRVVRWLLNFADRPDMKFVWMSSIGDYPVLNVPFIETDVFCFDGRVRSGVAVWAGKGSIDHSLVPAGAQVITYGWPASRFEVAELLKSVEYLLSFDPYTAMNTEAAMCGTPVLVVDDGRWNLGLLSDATFGLAGITDRLDGLALARDEARSAFDVYQSSLPAMGVQVDEFVRITQGTFN